MLLSLLLVVALGILGGFAIALFDSSEEWSVKVWTRIFVLLCSVAIVYLCVDSVLTARKASQELKGVRHGAAMQEFDRTIQEALEAVRD